MIEHIFVVMFENRSFDQMFGFSAIQGTDAESGKPTVIDGLAGTESNPSPSGGTVTVSHPAKFVLPADPGHEYPDVLEQMCGKNGKFSTPPHTRHPGPNGQQQRVRVKLRQKVPCRGCRERDEVFRARAIARPDRARTRVCGVRPLVLIHARSHLAEPVLPARWNLWRARP